MDYGLWTSRLLDPAGLKSCLYYGLWTMDYGLLDSLTFAPNYYIIKDEDL